MRASNSIAVRIAEECDQGLLSQLQVFHNFGEPDPNKKSVLIVHTLPDDPSVQHLKDHGWRKYNKLVFVSHWQQEQFYLYFGIPYSDGTVLYDGIEPIKLHSKTNPEKGKLRLMYNLPPERGLDYLYVVFNELCNEYDNLHLQVFSDFNTQDRDYKKLRDALNNHPKITYSQKVSNDMIRKALEKTHIFAYPCVWQETSCLSLIEALSAGCYCIHPALGALKETSLGITHMYPFQDDRQKHIDNFYIELKKAILLHHHSFDYVRTNTETTKTIADYKYDWSARREQWNKLFEQVLSSG